MQGLVAEWYALLSTLSATVTGPVSAVGEGIGVPVVSVLLFGLIGAASPCQLTTNAGALAYIARRASTHRAVTGSALAYVLGKALVYTVVGTGVILAGQHLAHRAIPVIVVARQLVGPLMILLGLHLLGYLPLRFALGHRLTDWLTLRAGAGGSGAFLLGVAFAFTFCPTLFLLFFGLTIPLALHSPVGLVYPAAFALGTSLPLLGLAGLLSAAAGAKTRALVGLRRAATWLRPVAAVVLLLAGLHDTLTYWFL